MTVLVYLVGALLVLAGAVFISMGVPIVRLEIGWSEIIGGAVAGSAGFVVLALGVVVSRLEDLRRAVLGLNVTAALRESFAEAEPAWEAPSEPRFAPHPLAPVPAPAPAAAAFAVPVPVEAPHAEPAPPEPHLEPEPPLAEAPLHPAEPEPVEDLPPIHPVAAPPDSILAVGAPALVQPDEERAPPLPPVEAVPADALAEPEPEEEPLPLPPPIAAPPTAPAMPGDAARTRPNFLATFLARRSATSSLVNRMTPPRERTPVEPPPLPLRQLDLGEAPARTSVDLSSGWGDAEPPHHVPAGTADEPAPPVPAADLAPVEHIVDGPAQDEVPAAVEREHREEPSVEAAPPLPDLEPEPQAEAEPEPLAPVVVGRYNAGSASYIMYSDGMIEVETETGTHRFASMGELKAFIERRDAAKV